MKTYLKENYLIKSSTNGMLKVYMDLSNMHDMKIL